MFQLISLAIALPALLKACTGLLLPDRFFGWRRGQYASTSIPPVMLIVPSLFVALAAACTPAGGPAATPLPAITALPPAATATATAVATAGPSAVTPTTAVVAATFTGESASPTTMTPTTEPPTPFPEPGLPQFGSLETPPATGCVVYQSGQVSDQDLPSVRSGPASHFDIIGQLGRNRWANGLQMQNGWFEIVIGPGQTGWVAEVDVGVQGDCGPASGPALPLLTNRGAPSNYRCVAMRVGAATEAPPIYPVADISAAPVARLGNWADVRRIQPGWYEISFPTGGFGWVEAGAVALNAGCGTAGPIRIQFPAGSTATAIEGKLPAQAQVEYIFRAAAGQWLEIAVTSPGNSVLFHLEGIEGGQVLKHLLDGEATWQGTLPASQEYLLTLDNVGEVTAYTIDLAIRDQP